MNIPDIQKRMRAGEPIAPDQISKMLVQLAGEYAYYASMMESILVDKPHKWSQIRSGEEIGSDKQCDREWDKTDAGKDEIGLRLRMKSIEKMMSALRSMAETARRELDNVNL